MQGEDLQRFIFLVLLQKNSHLTFLLQIVSNRFNFKNRWYSIKVNPKI